MLANLSGIPWGDPAGRQDHIPLCSSWDRDRQGHVCTLSALGQGLPYSPKRSLPGQGSCFAACCTGLSLWVVPGVMKLVACFSTETDAFFFLDVCWPSEGHGDGTSCTPSSLSPSIKEQTWKRICTS